MVFRGRYSKACERCRSRRLKCDLHSSSCGSCVRANVPCTGYRDTRLLRIQDESQSVARKVSKNSAPLEIPYLPLSIDLQARCAFFTHYVGSRCWAFIKPYHHPTASPTHLTLAIDAVSLAYLWHELYSDAALAAGRERYVSALHTMNKTLELKQETTKDTTLMTSLLLDLFERFTDSETQENDKPFTSHIEGALALVRLRGVEQFQKPYEQHMLVRLSANYMFHCIASDASVPDEFYAIRSHTGGRFSKGDPQWQLSNLMVGYANFRSRINSGTLSDVECIEASIDLDLKLQALDDKLPSNWHYSTTLLDYPSERVFGLHFDTYSDSRACQTRNVLRVIRVLLNMYLIEQSSTSSEDSKYSALIPAARSNIATLVSEICACVPQYVDCDGAARQRLPASEKLESLDRSRDYILGRSRLPGGHTHLYAHELECYGLIFPLYVAATSRALPELRPWVIRQLRYMGNHFYLRNAEVVAGILERGVDVNPWKIYIMLGGYAFAV